VSVDQATIDAAYAQVLLSENELENARTAFKPFENKPESNLTRAFLQAELAAAQQEYDGAVRYYNSLTGGASELDLALALSNLELAQLALEAALADQARLNTAPFPLGYEQELALHQNAVERAQILLELAQLSVLDLDEAIAGAQILAPFDGQILSLSLTEGRFVEAYQRALVIADVTELEVRAELTGSELNGLTRGMPVQVELFNAPGAPIEGIIRQLPIFNIASDDADPYTRVQLSVPLSETGFELDDRVRVRVVLEEKSDVLWLPPQAIRTFEGRNFIVLQGEDGQRRIDVKVGLTTSDRVEILFVEGVENLTEGLLVVGP
jgi:multidrug resistance efflux pump